MQMVADKNFREIPVRRADKNIPALAEGVDGGGVQWTAKSQSAGTHRPRNGEHSFQVQDSTIHITPSPPAEKVFYTFA